MRSRVRSSPLRPSQSPRREPSFPGLSAAQLGMYIGLASLSVLFLASLVGYFVTRLQSPVWRDTATPGLPWGLHLSTLILILLSAALRFGETGIERNDAARLVTGLRVGLALGVVFLLSQAANWLSVERARLSGPPKSLYEFTFYMLTGLHALHVIAGLVPLAIVSTHAARRQYSSSHFEPVHLTRQYWDFLLAVWIVLLGSICLGA